MNNKEKELVPIGDGDWQWQDLYPAQQVKGTLIPAKHGDQKQIAIRLPAHEFDEYAAHAAKLGVPMASLLRVRIRVGHITLKRMKEKEREQ
jgi:hypothetical protein